MKIIAFGASNSKNSINKEFAKYTASLFQADEIEILDLNDFELPIYSIDNEDKENLPKNAIDFVNKIHEADLLIISFAEYNGSYTSAFKNLFDWASRVKPKCFENLNMFLLSTSTGQRGGASVMSHALDRFPRHGANIVSHFIFPNFNLNFSDSRGITHEEFKKELNLLVEDIKSKVFVS
jgi:chromate reductase, NAD(P)H dehydrogenase (quinone)